MLDRLKLAVSLEQLSEKLFPDVTQTLSAAVAMYRRIAADPTFEARARDAEASFLVPSWQRNLCDFYLYEPASDYSVLAVDGSQVYPDRHIAGAGCFLLNVGGARFTYSNESSVDFFSDPEVCPFTDFAAGTEAVSVDTVDLLREARELSRAVVESEKLTDTESVVLIDGTIIFWMLEGKTTEVRTYFMNEYLQQLNALYERKMVCAGYISMPKSREVMSLVKLGLCRFSVANCAPCHAVYDTFPCKIIDSLVDAHLMSQLLEPGQRSTLFATSSHISADYPAYLKPWFFYLNVGTEIVRLEIPAWVAEDERFVARVCRVALDQAEKGGGYPVVLAEAHEQAVVKAVDREFFYQLITKIGMQRNRTVRSSLKSVTKRSMRF